MYRFLAATLAFLSLAAVARGQGAAYQWKETAFSFGAIGERDGDVTHRFKLVNKGPEPITIVRADASCGCTTPTFSGKPVAAGDTAFVDVVFHPAGRPGAFTKTVKVETDGQPALSDIVISGVVKAREMTTEERYPDTLGHGLRIANRYLNLGDLSPEARTGMEFTVHNLGKAPAGLRALGLPGWMTLRLVPARIPPGGEGKLRLSYSGKKRNDYGLFTEPIQTETTGPAPARRSTLFAVVNVSAADPLLSDAELAKREQLTLDSATFRLGGKRTDRLYTAKYVLRNTGPAPLRIYAVKPACACIRTELLATTVKPGQSTELYAHWDTKGLNGAQSQHLTLYTSDPRNAAVELTVAGTFYGPKPTQPVDDKSK